MVRLHGLKVEFLINGQTAVELTDPDHSEVQGEVTRYIEAGSGDLFALRCTIPAGFVAFPPDEHLSFKLELDGETRRTLSNKPRQKIERVLLIDAGFFKTNSGPSLRAFKVADLQTHGQSIW